MNKEKNLVYLNEYGAARVSSSRVTGQLANGSWCGTAIDRLHEFEKLGMEPEEIEKMKSDYPNILQQMKEAQDGFREERKCNNRQANTITDLMERNDTLTFLSRDQQDKINRMLSDIHVLKHENEQLRSLNQRLYDNIAELQGYIKDLEEDCEYFKGERDDTLDELAKKKMEIRGLTKENIERTSFEGRILAENEELRRQLDNLKQSLKILSK